MDTFMYLIVIIGLTIFIIFYGGHNNQELIEYDSNYFSGLNSIISFEKKINIVSKLSDKKIFLNNNFYNINKFLNTTNILIPNFVNCFMIKILPHNAFNIFNLIDQSDAKTHMMIVFNYNLNNNLELIVENNFNNIGNFYKLTKTISIVSIHHLFNNSNNTIIISCFILKKPFWFN